MAPASYSITFSFQSRSVQFELNEGQKGLWIEKIIRLESKIPGDLNYVFCTDKYLLDINKKYLDHDTFTDIITFNYVQGDLISGEIYISIPRVKDNAKDLGLAFEDELDRVMAHGVLHLLGYNDQTDIQKSQMRSREDYYLTLRP